MKKRKDGRYCDRKTVNGKAYYGYGATQREAHLNLIKSIENAEKKQNTPVTFREISKLWYDDKWDTFSYGTKNCYRSAMERALTAFGDEKAGDVTPMQIKKLLEELKQKKYSAKTVKTEKSVISTIYRHAIESGVISCPNPATAVELPKDLPREIRTTPEDDDIEKIKNDTSWIYPQILLYTGCRRGEALALTYEDFDFEKNTVTINKEIVFESNEPHLVHHTKTSAGIRTVPLLDKLKTQIDRSGTGPLFKNTLRTFKTEWKHYCDRLEINVTPHQLRHAYATLLFDAGVEVKIAQKLLGHSTIKMTQDVYTHIRTSRITDTTDKLNAFLI